MAVGMAFMGAVVASETTSSFSTASYNGNSNNRMSSTIIASGSSSNSRSASSRSSSQSPVDRFDIDYDVETNNNNNTEREFMQARERLMMGTTTTTASISNNNNNNTIIGGRFRNSKSTHSQSARTHAHTRLISRFFRFKNETRQSYDNSTRVCSTSRFRSRFREKGKLFQNRESKLERVIEREHRERNSRESTILSNTLYKLFENQLTY